MIIHALHLTPIYRRTSDFKKKKRIDTLEGGPLSSPLQLRTVVKIHTISLSYLCVKHGL